MLAPYPVQLAPRTVPLTVFKSLSTGFGVLGHYLAQSMPCIILSQTCLRLMRSYGPGSPGLFQVGFVVLILLRRKAPVYPVAGQQVSRASGVPMQLDGLRVNPSMAIVIEHANEQTRIGPGTAQTCHMSLFSPPPSAEALPSTSA